MFPAIDPLLGPEMRSTGEVLGMADSYGMAFFKAQEATQTPLPVNGTVLITIADRDKEKILEAARISGIWDSPYYQPEEQDSFLKNMVLLQL